MCAENFGFGLYNMNCFYLFGVRIAQQTRQVLNREHHIVFSLDEMMKDINSYCGRLKLLLSGIFVSNDRD